jgi:hypothetical protein
MQHLDPRPEEQTLLTFLATLRLGTPLVRGPLAVIPVYRDAVADAPPYQPLAQAIASGDATVAEQPSATVPTLSLINHGPLPILILDGEEVVGGKQNRVVELTLLVPPKTTFDLPVSCVEHGRWHDVAPTFAAGEAAYPTLRREKMARVAASVEVGAAPRGDQGAVWDEIATRHHARGTRSATGAMRDLYLQHEGLDRTAADLSCPDDGPVGVVALIGGRAACADLFDRPEALRAYWTRLVRSYALEAAEAQPADPSIASAQRLLARPAKARRAVADSPGLGRDVRVRGNGVLGTALVHDGAVLHAALFRQRRATANEPIQRPSLRAHRIPS